MFRIKIKFKKKKFVNICIFNPFPNKPWFVRVFISSLLKTLWEKEKLLVKSNFSFSHRVFYSFLELSAIFTKFENCLLQILTVWKSLKSVVWERVKALTNKTELKKAKMFVENIIKKKTLEFT